MGEAVAWACTMCNSPRKIDPCPKCGTPLRKPADGWEWPTLPDVERIRALAREVGYAVGVHGSLERDLDLIAAPWTAEAVEPLQLAQHIAAGLGGTVVDYQRQDKPCGRWACNIHTPDWMKMIDLSVMSPALSLGAAPQAGEDARDLAKTHTEAWTAANALATILHAKHYAENTGWRLDDSLFGVILQIDNMTSGLAKPVAALPVEGWRPIGEDHPAPPHDQPVLLYSPPSMGWSSPVGKIEARPFSTGRSGPGWSEYSRHSWATHWMPLPTPPDSQGGEDA